MLTELIKSLLKAEMIYVTVYMSNVYLILIHNTMICIDNFYLEYKPNKTGDIKRRQTYFTTHKMVQMSNVCISNGLPMHQNFILKLFELHRVQISVQDFVLIEIYILYCCSEFLNLEEFLNCVK